MISCPDDSPVTQRGARGRIPVPLGAHAHSRGTDWGSPGQRSGELIGRGQPPSVPPVEGLCAWATIGSVLRWMTP